MTTCLLIVAATTERTVFASVLATAPLTWIGKRSYAIYLWHWPIVVFTRPDADIDLHGMASYAYRIGLTLVLAELSFRLVEAPWRMSPAIGRSGGRPGTDRLHRPGADGRWWSSPASPSCSSACRSPPALPPA